MTAKACVRTLPSPLLMALPLAALLIAVPLLVHAHIGHGETGAFGAGWAHPLGGADHALAMIAVGLWAAVSGGRALWAMPAAFVVAMLAGAVGGAAGLPLPGVEPIILASVVVLGVATALALRAPLAQVLPAIALFGLAHGAAHGAEGPASGLLAYGAGFAAATVALHLAGLALGLGVARAHAALPRVFGAGAAGAGLLLAVGGAA